MVHLSETVPVTNVPNKDIRTPLDSSMERAEQSADEHLVIQAQSGDMNALDHLVRKHQPWIFNLAIRMVWRREIAEDATQEILVKAVTKLGTFQGKSQFRTWLHRIAINHLLNVQKSEMEEKAMTFTDMAQSLDAVPDLDLPDPRSVPVELSLLIEEAKVGCTIAMLMCLDRKQRLAFILGEVFGVNSELGAEVMETSAENFRQLLTRARRDLYQFMNDKCGLINQNNPCRCPKKTQGFIRNGWLDPKHLQFNRERTNTIQEVAPDRLNELQEADRRQAEIFREHPFIKPPDFATKLRQLLRNTSIAQ